DSRRPRRSLCSRRQVLSLPVGSVVRHYFTWAAAEEADIPATPEVIERALATALATDTARSTELWDGLTTNQRRLLEAIGDARSSDHVLSETFRRSYRLGAYAT